MATKKSVEISQNLQHSTRPSPETGSNAFIKQYRRKYLKELPSIAGLNPLATPVPHPLLF
jgi:hypothetical protein